MLDYNKTIISLSMVKPCMSTMVFVSLGIDLVLGNGSRILQQNNLA